MQNQCGKKKNRQTAGRYRSGEGRDVCVLLPRVESIEFSVPPAREQNVVVRVERHAANGLQTSEHGAVISQRKRRENNDSCTAHTTTHTRVRKQVA